MSEIEGIMISGVRSLLENHYELLELSQSEQYMDVVGRVDEEEVFTDPVWLSAELIDQAIENGGLVAGAFDNVDCSPGPDEWPERWRGLKTKA